MIATLSCEQGHSFKENESSESEKVTVRTLLGVLQEHEHIFCLRTVKQLQDKSHLGVKVPMNSCLSSTKQLRAVNPGDIIRYNLMLNL